MSYEQHPLSAAFPSMTKADLDALTEDIAENGLLTPITIYEGKVIDGWHRYQACRACGRVPNIVQLSANVDPVAFVKSHNLHRRHLSGSQRAAAVVACNGWVAGGRPQKGEPGSPFHQTVSAMAKEAEVSERTIQQAKAAHAAGLGEAVRDGKLTAKKAAARAKFSEEECRSTETAAPTPSDKEMVSIPKAELDALNSQIKELQESLAEATADNAAMGKVFDADDRLAAAAAEVKRLAGMETMLKSRIDGLMLEKSDAVRMAKSWMRKFQALEKEAKIPTSGGLPV
ncbi:ParB N-terminal domain-containing protein [Geomonas nitrogeniifigens]|uniref:ParB N-terminal domain-containing protein n=1 Tax=Geomonas diazotrophica TaxID=2843197 RepID=A0ABX8JPX2_9BACT|nr:ParB N-terminal domain-containing protein [Geomonas nitrogeniifigens]QWV97470.1 ParB N-terminal domain-containing protein [Geomonas nitrogeniifigens]